VSEATHGGQLLIDRVCCQAPEFQVHTVTNDDDAVESQARLRAIPGDELIDGVLVNAA
jgi:hypothetical protein